MSNELFKFTELGESARKELAQKVLLGQASICVLITFDCFGLSRNDSGYEVVDDVSKRHHSNKHDNPFFDRFDSGQFIEYDDELKTHYTTSYNWRPDYSNHTTCLDHQALDSWISENNRAVKPSLYELVNSQEIAAEIVSGNPTDLYQGVSGFLEQWSLFRGVHIRLGEDTWELFSIHKLYNKFYIFEENGRTYCQAGYLMNVPLYFNLQNSKASSISRQSDLDYLINFYLDETNNAGGFPGFKRYMIDSREADITPGGRMTWPVPGEESKRLALGTIKNKLTKIKRKRKALT